MPNREQAIAEAFMLATEAPVWDRSSVLDGRGLDAEMRREVEELLSYDESHPIGFLSSPLRGPPSVGAASGDTIAGRYRLDAEIGEGSSGVVFSATQFEPIERRVAIKILKAGLDTRQIISRFDAERQTLAMLDHPGIARILDAGATERGRPFFVMDLIEGRPLIAYCDEHRLPISARLRLFESICDAVHHAHTKGVIHRDIKPGNIIVCDRGAHASPRVIDFGIARVLRDNAADDTRNTRRGQLLGTPAYMSPEQARGEVDIDTRSDIYSLGAVLYELLTGTCPIEHGAMRRVSPAQLERLICESDAPRPSTRVQRMDQGAQADDRARRVARDRASSPVELARKLRGDLDAIIMMAMAKDRARRYQTVLELAADLRAFRRGEPVTARAPSARYRLSRFVARNRLAVLSAVVIAVLSIGASVTISVLGVRSMRAAALAQTSAREAVHQREVAVAVQLFMQNMLASAGELDDNGMNVTMLDVLASTTEQLDAGALRADPEVEAEVRYFLGQTYFRMSWTPLATEHFRKALEWYDSTKPFGHKSRVQSLWYLGEALKEGGNLQEALAMFERCYAESLEANDPGDSRVWFALDQIGNTYYRLGRTSEALSCHQRAYEELVSVFGPDSPYIGATLFNIGAVLETLGRANEAEPMIVESIALLERGATPQLLTAMRARNVLAMRILVPQGRIDEAERLLLESRAFASRELGPKHGETAGVEFSIGTLRREQGRVDEALDSFETYRAFIDRTRSPDDQELLMIHTEIATVLIAQQDWRGAWDAYDLVGRRARAGLAEIDEAALAHRAKVLHVYAERADRGRAQVLLALGEPARAQAHAQMAIDNSTVSRPDDLTNSAGVEARRIWTLCRMQLGDAEAQVEWLRAAYAASAARLGAQHPLTARIADTLGMALWVTGHRQEGAALIAAAAPVLERDFGSRSVPRWTSSAAALGIPVILDP